MKRVKLIAALIYFFAIVPFGLASQNDSTNFFISCDDKKLSFDTLILSRQLIKYKVIDRHRYSDLEIGGTIIMPDIAQGEMNLVFEILKVLGPMYNINYVTAFKTCGARFIYMSSYPPGSKERRMMEGQFLGKYSLHSSGEWRVEW